MADRVMRPPTARQTRFVAEYLIDLNGTDAAVRAGDKRKWAEHQAYENLRKPQISRAIATGKARQLAVADLSAIRVLEELRRIAFTDLGAFFDEHGQVKPMHLLTEEQGAQLAGFEVIIKNAKAGDGVTDTIWNSSCGTR